MNFSDKLPMISARKMRIFSGAVMLAVLASCNFSFGGGDSPKDPGIQESEGPAVDLSKPVKVAVLVSDGGGDAGLNAIGSSIENAAKLAYSRQNRGEIELDFYHTGGSPARAAELARQAEAAGAKLILGPLKSEEAAAVDQAVSLPVMSFSNNSEIASRNIYVLGTTLENVADRVLSYQKSNGGKSLGIVYPNNISGTIGRSASTKAAESNNIEVVANEGYVLTQADIQASGARIANNLRSSGANMVMFTDYPAGGLGYVGMALRDNGFTTDNAQYMGLARWEDGAARLSEAGFNGGLYTLPDPVRTSEFEGIYQGAYGQAPHGLAGLGYDGVLAAIQFVRNARRASDNTPFSSKDIQGTRFYGANGAVRFDNHIAWRGLAIMRLTGDHGVLVSQAPKDM